MSRSHGPFLIATVAAAAAAAGFGCHRAGSILLVEVAGDLSLMVAQLQVTVMVGTETRMFTIPPNETAISLPASFSVELDDSLNGPVTVTVEAFDQASNVVGSGVTMQDHINVGAQTIITVTLGSGTTQLAGGDAGAAAAPGGDQ